MLYNKYKICHNTTLPNIIYLNIIIYDIFNIVYIICVSIYTIL